MGGRCGWGVGARGGIASSWPIRDTGGVSADEFLVVRNPNERSRLPYLVWLPLDGGIALAAKEAWPRTGRVFCLELEDWPEAASEAEVVDREAVRSLRRRGVAVDLRLDRGREARSQFVFTRLKDGRPAVFWQTAKTARASRPGQRVPTRRAQGHPDVEIVRDRRERYGYRFPNQQGHAVDGTLDAGDYGIVDEGGLRAAVERKSLDNLVASLTDGSLGFQLQELAEVERAAVVVEARYPDLTRLEHVQPGFVLDLLARVQVRYPGVPIVFADSRKMAEEWTYRFLAAARRELSPADPEGDPDPRR